MFLFMATHIFASRSVTKHKKEYEISEFETLELVWEV